MSYDLFLQTYPASPVTEPQAGWARALQAHSQLMASCEITFFDSEPDELAVDELEDLIDSGEDAIEVFEEFCESHGLPADPMDPRSAAAYLESQDGRALASIQLPQSESSVRSVYASLVLFAATNGLRLLDPQAGSDIDLANPGDLPPHWR